MLDGYNRIFDGFYMNVRQNYVAVPDAALAIGYAEDLSPKLLPLMTYQSSIATAPVWETINSVSDAAPKWQGKQVYQNEFDMSGWVGDPYGVV